MTKFIITLSVITLLVVGGCLWLGFKPSFFYQSVILLFLSTGGLFYYLIEARRNRPEFFVQLYLLTIAVKLLAYGAYVGIIVWQDRPEAINNVVFFLVVYVIFTATEVLFLVRIVDPKA